jgi:hypothetical protein
LLSFIRTGPFYHSPGVPRDRENFSPLATLQVEREDGVHEGCSAIHGDGLAGDPAGAFRAELGDSVTEAGWGPVLGVPGSGVILDFLWYLSAGRGCPSQIDDVFEERSGGTYRRRLAPHHRHPAHRIGLVSHRLLGAMDRGQWMVEWEFLWSDR